MKPPAKIVLLVERNTELKLGGRTRIRIGCVFFYFLWRLVVDDGLTKSKSERDRCSVREGVETRTLLGRPRFLLNAADNTCDNDAAGGEGAFSSSWSSSESLLL